MPLTRGCVFYRLVLVLLLCGLTVAHAQNGAIGSVHGTVTDPSGAVVSNAVVVLRNPVSGFSRSLNSDASGRFDITNIPFNNYHLAISAQGFSAASQDVDVRSIAPVVIAVKLEIASAATTVEVKGDSDLTENDPTFHVDVDRDLLQKLPVESQSSSLSSIVTLTAPGVAADSNGLFHGLGDHASNSFSVDGQSITDQQSKVFSNQLPSNAVQSLSVIEGAPPAEYGGKTSLVIVATTRSGQGETKPTGSITASYGSFGSGNGSVDVGYGGQNWGNFYEVDGMNTSRFLDGPEFVTMHDHGNELNLFDRVDYNLSNTDSVHLNMNYSRSWFQTPNSYDNINVQNVIADGTSASPTFGSVGNADQRSEIETYNIAPTFTRILNANSVFNFGVYIRRDAYHYFGSNDPLADLGPTNLQTSSVNQYRTLTNTGLNTNYSYAKGIHTFKAGLTYNQTFLHEGDALGIVDATYNSPCVNADGSSLAGYTAGNCGENTANSSYDSLLAPYDLTRGGDFYRFLGHTDVKELALYMEDQIKVQNWVFNVGMRGDFYNGLTVARQAEPRAGISYTVKPSGTVLAISYARTLETPFNENLVLSSTGCSNAVLAPLLSCSRNSSGTGYVSGTMEPGFRNEFHASVQQAFGKYFVVGGEYIWKYTHNAFDFSVLGNTPITFPVAWHNSKIPGYALHASVPDFHGISAYVVMSSVAARFFPPQSAGAGTTVGSSGYPFRIDHDEKFNQTTHIQYQLPALGRLKTAPWIGFNWRYDSGLVAGSVPCYNDSDPNSLCNPANGGSSITLPDGQPGVDLSGLTADQQFEAGLICDGVRATPSAGFTSCDAAGLTSHLVKIPTPGTEDDDKNPPRIAPRHLFDASVGEDNLFNGERYKWSLRLTGVNLANKYALYNFLSTFSGTHYVTPRALTAEVGFHF